MTWYVTYYLHNEVPQGDRVYEVEAEFREQIETRTGLADAVRSQQYDVLEISGIPISEVSGSAKLSRDAVLRNTGNAAGIVAVVDGFAKEGLALCIDAGNHLEVTPASQRKDKAA